MTLREENTEGNKILFLGGGGHARVLIDLISAKRDYEIVGILDPGLEAGTFVNGVAVLGGEDLLPGLVAEGIRNVCIAIGSIRDNSDRRKLYMMAKGMGLSVPSLIHPGAIVSAMESFIAEGVQVMAGAVINTGCQIRENTIVNTGAVIEHDCRIGRHVHICPGVVICGGSIVGDNAFIGAGSTVTQYIEIGSDAVVGAGALVRKNIPEGSLVKGICPA